MTDHFIALEQRLIEAYESQLRQYDRAIAIVAQPGQSVHELNAILNVIAELEVEIAEDKTVWRFSGHRPGPIFRNVLDGVGERIRTLAALVDERFLELQASKNALMPQIDESIQQRRMLSAYGKSN